MTIVSLEQKRKEEAIAKIRTACLLVNSAIDVLCDAAVGERGMTRVINHLRQVTGNLIPGTGMLGTLIELLGGEV